MNREFDLNIQCLEKFGKVCYFTILSFFWIDISPVNWAVLKAYTTFIKIKALTIFQNAFFVSVQVVVQVPIKKELNFYCSIFLRKFLLIYLIGHNNPINGFRSAATHPSRRLCFLRAYAGWLHQSMTSVDQIPVSPEHPPPYERHGRASAAAEFKKIR